MTTTMTKAQQLANILEQYLDTLFDTVIVNTLSGQPTVLITTDEDTDLTEMREYLADVCDTMQHTAYDEHYTVQGIQVIVQPMEEC